ncbi:phistb domain-containing resa-like protein [Anaeramoeba flamelloides]|uniref:Phistb domain-containing resa-like protein n=1 Tax=Anaeramoeba flamelloides TaxID=1746091 RepID=A0AAV7Z9G1_9EUKA|nr:phistb domain-containing resa-like protein [Anaeramoeba flamelloides]
MFIDELILNKSINDHNFQYHYEHSVRWFYILLNYLKRESFQKNIILKQIFSKLVNQIGKYYIKNNEEEINKLASFCCENPIVVKHLFRFFQPLCDVKKTSELYTQIITEMIGDSQIQNNHNVNNNFNNEKLLLESLVTKFDFQLWVQQYPDEESIKLVIRTILLTLTNEIYSKNEPLFEFNLKSLQSFLHNKYENLFFEIFEKVFMLFIQAESPFCSIKIFFKMGYCHFSIEKYQRLCKIINDCLNQVKMELKRQNKCFFDILSKQYLYNLSILYNKIINSLLTNKDIHIYNDKEDRELPFDLLESLFNPLIVNYNPESESVLILLNNYCKLLISLNKLYPYTLNCFIQNFIQIFFRNTGIHFLDKVFNIFLHELPIRSIFPDKNFLMTLFHISSGVNWKLSFQLIVKQNWAALLQSDSELKNIDKIEYYSILIQTFLNLLIQCSYSQLELLYPIIKHFLDSHIGIKQIPDNVYTLILSQHKNHLNQLNFQRFDNFNHSMNNILMLNNNFNHNNHDNIFNNDDNVNNGNGNDNVPNNQTGYNYIYNNNQKFHFRKNNTIMNKLLFKKIPKLKKKTKNKILLILYFLSEIGNVSLTQNFENFKQFNDLLILYIEKFQNIVDPAFICNVFHYQLSLYDVFNIPMIIHILPIFRIFQNNQSKRNILDHLLFQMNKFIRKYEQQCVRWIEPIYYSNVSFSLKIVLMERCLYVLLHQTEGFIQATKQFFQLFELNDYQKQNLFQNIYTFSYFNNFIIRERKDFRMDSIVNFILKIFEELGKTYDNYIWDVLKQIQLLIENNI